MTLHLYNTLTRSKDEFKPLVDSTVRMYTCGLTVYSQPHIGNWVSYIYWDVLERVLTINGYTVDRVQNITDVGHLVSDDDDGEDKMEKGARLEGVTAWQVADKYIVIAEHEAYDLLQLKKPKLVRATACIDKQIDFVKVLEQKGFTYEIRNEGVYFDTSKLNDYGKLARLDIDGLEEGARVATEGKKNPTDFALWKFSPKDQKRDMEWESPWGVGFPGWHLECSVIAREGLGDQIDIHTGGIDHIPVHHTNEIAQTESLTGKQFSQFWVHNNHIKVDGTKMSKSLGNIYTLKDITDKGYGIDAFKLTILSKHYRTEGNFTWDILEASQNRLLGYRKISALLWQGSSNVPLLPENYFEHRRTEIVNALNDDLNTPKALAILSEALAELSKQRLHTSHVEAFRSFLIFVSDVLGIDLLVPDISKDQQALLQQRIAAKEAKDWPLADSLRDQLKSAGIAIDDTAQQQYWSYERLVGSSQK